MRVTFGDLKASRIPKSLGISASDPRLIQWVNDAMQHLLWLGKWWGTCPRFKMCATEGCITLPRQIATLERVAICGQSVPIHDLWFEFLENGAGIRDEDSCWREANYRGNFPTFSDIKGTGKKLLFVCDLVGDVGKTVLALGYDQNGNWIRTNQGGSYADGELIAYAQGAGTQSVNQFSSLTDLQLPSNMTGQSWLYEYSTTAMTQRMIGQYQNDETRPSYARYFFPSLSGQAANNACGMVAVDAIGKLEFIPVAHDSDYLIIGNLPALKEMMVALKNSEDEANGVAANQIILAGQALAVRLLDAELDHYLGSGRRIGIELLGSSLGFVDPVQNFV